MKTVNYKYAVEFYHQQNYLWLIHHIKGIYLTLCSTVIQLILASSDVSMLICDLTKPIKKLCN